MSPMSGAGGYAAIGGSGGAVPLPTSGGAPPSVLPGGIPPGAGGNLLLNGGFPGAGGSLLPPGNGGAAGALGSGGASGAPPNSGGTIGTGGEPGDGGSGSGGAPPGNCGVRTGKRGKTVRTTPGTVGSLQRTFIAYLPAAANPATPVPLVYVFHGATQTGAGLYDATEYSKIADSDGIAVVFPDGQATSSATGAGSLTPWNVTDGPGLCGFGTLVSNLNPVDFAFIDAINGRDEPGPVHRRRARLRHGLFDGRLPQSSHRVRSAGLPRRRSSLRRHDGDPRDVQDRAHADHHFPRQRRSAHQRSL